MANDIASLGISVSSTGAQTAANELDNLSASSSRAEKSAAGLTGGVGLLKGALAGMVASFSIGVIGSVADEWSDLSSRVDLAAGSVEKGTAVMGRLQKMANATYSSLRVTTEGYISNATSLRAMGKSTQETLDYTEALNNAMVVSGAKAERAAAVQGALSKAMALGKLSGDNLNTVLQQGGRVAELLAEKLGTTVPGLIAMGQQGKITSEVITSSLISSMEKLAEEADSMQATIGDAFQRIQNNVLSFVGTLDQAMGSSGALAEVLLTVADNIDRLIVYTGTAAFAFGTIYVGAIGVAAIATGGLSGALFVLQKALLATGIGALAVIVGELVYQLIQARKASNDWGEAFSMLAGRLLDVWDGIKTGWSALVQYMQSLWYKLMANVYQSTDRMVTGLMRLFGISADDAEALGAQYELMGETAGRYALDGFQKSSEQIKNALREFKDEIENIPLDSDGGGGSGALGEVDGKKGGSGGGKSRADRAAERLAHEMEHRLEILKQGLMTEEETVLAQYEKDLETLNWHLENKKMSELEYLDWRQQINREHEEEMMAIRLQGYSNALSATGEMMGAMAQVVGGNNERMLKAQRIFGAASALIDTYIGAAKALSGPFPGNIAAAALVIAKGMALVGAIKSGSKSASGGGGSSSPQVSAAPQEKPQVKQMAEIKVHGEVFDREAVIGLIEKINDVQKDGHVINWSTA